MSKKKRNAVEDAAKDVGLDRVRSAPTPEEISAARTVLRMLALLPDDFLQVAEGDEATELSQISCGLFLWADEIVDDAEAARATSLLIEEDAADEEGGES